MHGPGVDLAPSFHSISSVEGEIGGLVSGSPDGPGDGTRVNVAPHSQAISSVEGGVGGPGAEARGSQIQQQVEKHHNGLASDAEHPPPS